MIKNLSFDFNLRGYAFEYVARIMLRRQKKNNFIFNTFRFDNFNEVIKKYRLNKKEISKELIDFVNDNWRCFDIIEIILKNKQERIIKDLIFYDVKTKWHEVERDFFESCKSNHKFMKKISDLFNKKSYIISIIIFDNWRFSFNLYEYNSQKIRVYSNYKK